MVFAAATRSLACERSMASSAALIGFPDSRGDWVRPGLMLYGISSFRGATGTDHGLRPVMTLCSRVIAVKQLAEGEQVGYGGDWTATRPTRLAINGERAGVAGRVSMDMLAIDVTEMHRPAKVGDPVVLWGEGLPVEEIALWAETVPYTLVCGISQRVAVTLRE